MGWMVNGKGKRVLLSELVEFRMQTFSIAAAQSNFPSESFSRVLYKCLDDIPCLVPVHSRFWAQLHRAPVAQISRHIIKLGFFTLGLVWTSPQILLVQQESFIILISVWIIGEKCEIVFELTLDNYFPFHFQSSDPYRNRICNPFTLRSI